MAITAKYRKYLFSDKWRSKRQRVLKRAKFRCERCKRRKAVQVHHKTYKRIYNENLADLMAVCEPCHRAIHGIKTPKVSAKRQAVKFLTKVFFS